MLLPETSLSVTACLTESLELTFTLISSVLRDEEHFHCLVLLIMAIFYQTFLMRIMLMLRFIGNLDLCGQQVSKPCRTSMGFPVVLPHAESDEAAGCCLCFIFILL